jgi:hypothetical protein
MVSVSDQEIYSCNFPEKSCDSIITSEEKTFLLKNENHTVVLSENNIKR